jgi:hypothetical protein
MIGIPARELTTVLGEAVTVASAAQKSPELPGSPRSRRGRLAARLDVARIAVFGSEPIGLPGGISVVVGTPTVAGGEAIPRPARWNVRSSVGRD